MIERGVPLWGITIYPTKVKLNTWLIKVYEMMSVSLFMSILIFWDCVPLRIGVAVMV